MEPSGRNVREVHADEEVKAFRRTRQLVERVKAWLTRLRLEQRDKRACQIPDGFIRFGLMPERKRPKMSDREEIKIDVARAKARHCA